jgi:hypothetical protein
MLIKLNSSFIRAFMFSNGWKAFSVKNQTNKAQMTQTVKISEQTIKVRNQHVTYVKSSIEEENPTKTLICLPGSLGKKSGEMFS